MYETNRRNTWIALEIDMQQCVSCGYSSDKAGKLSKPHSMGDHMNKGSCYSGLCVLRLYHSFKKCFLHIGAFICSCCNSPFSNKDSLRKHIMAKHKMNSNEVNSMTNPQSRKRIEALIGSELLGLTKKTGYKWQTDSRKPDKYVICSQCNHLMFCNLLKQHEKKYH